MREAGPGLPNSALQQDVRWMAPGEIDCARALGARWMRTRGRCVMAVQSVNPATEEVLASFEEHSQRQIDEVLDQSVKSFRDWRERPFAERSRLMHAAATELRRDADRYALLITLEMGKPLAQSRAEVEKCAWCCDYFADNAEAFLADIPSPSSASESYVAFDPLGTILAIMPWNF